MELSEIIKEKIIKGGAISFHDYMEMALYHNESGYYSRLGDIGAMGDFYTSSNLTPAFGAMIARQTEQMWRLLGEPEFTIVEYGAGTGILCRDILTYLKGNTKLYQQLHYYIIEKSPVLRTIEQQHLKEKVTWIDSISEVPEFVGCVLSNELVDNLSVHKVTMEDDLMEIYVDYKDGFIEKTMPASAPLKNYFTELGITLPRGFCTEVSLEAIQWLQEIAAAMKKGYVITIDYGHLSDRLYHRCRSEGTLMCYHKHNINTNVYTDIGKQDITCHVNFSALMHWGEKFGLTAYGFTNQANFLVDLGFSAYLNSITCTKEDPMRAAIEARSVSYTLLMDMGSKFKVLAQGKNTDDAELQGFLKRSDATCLIKKTEIFSS